MTSSLPHSIDTCCPEGFGNIENPKTKKKCNDLVYELAKNPRPIALTNDVYTPNALTAASIPVEIFPTTTNQRRVNYWYMNPLDVIGPSKVIRFNRMTIHINVANTTILAGSIQFKAALYKLTAGATIGDASTYKDNSEKITESNVGSNATSFTRSIFIDIDFPTTTISAYDDEGNENHYFLALIRIDSINSTIYISSASNLQSPPSGPSAFSYCLNYAYQSNSQGVSTFSDNMNDSGTDVGNFLYYSLWYFE